jgi:HsdM N-terminal domain
LGKEFSVAIDIKEIEQRLWKAADQLRANSGLMPSQYSGPVLGLLFLRYAESRFAKAEASLKPASGIGYHLGLPPGRSLVGKGEHNNSERPLLRHFEVIHLGPSVAIGGIRRGPRGPMARLMRLQP